MDGQTALAIDLSVAGLFFEATHPFEVGDRVELVLPYEHPGHGASVSTVEVVRVEPRGRFYGVAATYEPASFTIPA